MPAPDPLGKNGPSLDNFLLFETIVNQKHCPYRKKCTYGTKCKFFHPERESKRQFKTAFESVSDEVQENRRIFENYKKGNFINDFANFQANNQDKHEILNSKEAIKKPNEKNVDFKKQILTTKFLSQQNLTNKFTNKMQNNMLQLQERSINNKDNNENQAQKSKNKEKI